MRACIYGAGAMGTVLGAMISRAGVDIDLVTRNAEHVRALNAGGAKIATPSGRGAFTQKVSALLPSEMTGVYDVIFLMTKQRDNAQVVASFVDHLAPDGVVCTLQNGLPEESVAAVCGRERTLGCAVSWGATYLSPGCVMLTSSPGAMTFSLGSSFGVNTHICLAEALLNCAGRVETVQNFVGARWAKLIVNSAFSTLSAVTGLTFGRVARGRKSRSLAIEMLAEGARTAKAVGVDVEGIQGFDLSKWLCGGALKRAVAFVALPLAMAKHSSLVSGMYFDLASGRRSEVDLVAGKVCSAAFFAGVPAPVLSAAVALAQSIERGEAALSPDNIGLLYDSLKANGAL